MTAKGTRYQKVENSSSSESLSPVQNSCIVHCFGTFNICPRDKIEALTGGSSKVQKYQGGMSGQATIRHRVKL